MKNCVVTYIKKYNAVPHIFAEGILQGDRVSQESGIISMSQSL